MTEEEIERATQLRSMVTAIMDAVGSAEPTQMGGQAVDGVVMIRAFQFITAAMLEAHPELTTVDELRGAAENQGQQIFGYARQFRQDFERTGEHPWSMLNAPPPVMQ